ncbi:MAG TPA: SUF system NifU family Fe-S cluster assembly protein [Bacilli bacterium]|nr:SUF system NifU family Fe-S cluster assembly protein [Bacilli bacterium]
MNNLEFLYRQIIMDHYKNPRNKGLKGYNHVHLHNPSCGDDVIVEANVENDVIQEINHTGSGCAICCSSTSVMSEVLARKTTQQALDTIQDFYHLVKGEPVQNEEALGDALVYQGVSQFPARYKCAVLAWKALEQLLKGEQDE